MPSLVRHDFLLDVRKQRRRDEVSRACIVHGRPPWQLGHSAREMPEKCQRNTRGMPEKCQRNAREMPEIPEKCQRQGNVPNLSKAHQGQNGPGAERRKGGAQGPRNKRSDFEPKAHQGQNGPGAERRQEAQGPCDKRSEFEPRAHQGQNGPGAEKRKARRRSS